LGPDELSRDGFCDTIRLIRWNSLGSDWDILSPQKPPPVGGGTGELAREDGRDGGRDDGLRGDRDRPSDVDDD